MSDAGPMTLPTRLALVAGLLLFAGALVATFLPSSPNGETCGTWVAPEWDDDTVRELLTDARRLYDRARADGNDEIAGEAVAIAADTQDTARVCGDALSTRRTVALALAAGAVVIPGGIVFVGSGMRRGHGGSQPLMTDAGPSEEPPHRTEN